MNGEVLFYDGAELSFSREDQGSSDCEGEYLNCNKPR